MSLTRLRNMKGMFTSLMLLLDDTVEPDHKQLEEIRSFDTIVFQRPDADSGSNKESISFLTLRFIQKRNLKLKSSRKMLFTSLLKIYQTILTRLTNFNYGLDKRLITSLLMVIRRMRLRIFSRKILKN